MLHVQGDVEIAFGTGGGRLVADGRRLVLEVDDANALARIVGRRSLGTFARALARAGWTLHVRSGDRQLLVAGAHARPGVVSRVLRLPLVELDPRFAIRSALGRWAA